MSPHTVHFAIQLTVYLLIGSLLMLAFNEFARPVTRGEFLKGMLMWPLLLACLVLGVVYAYVKRARS